MSNLKDKLKELFLYVPTEKYDFVLSENNATPNDKDLSTTFLPDAEIFSSLAKKYDYLKVQ